MEADRKEPECPGCGELEARLKEDEKKYLYLYAEFENYKKRVSQEQSELVRFGWKPIARELLEVVDNLERALKFAAEKDNSNLNAGLVITLKQLLGTLEKYDVRPVKAKGAEFDPNLHEAVGMVPSDQAKGTVVSEEAPGYTLHGKLLRPAQVLVSAGAEEDKTEKKTA